MQFLFIVLKNGCFFLAFIILMLCDIHCYLVLFGANDYRFSSVLKCYLFFLFFSQMWPPSRRPSQSEACPPTCLWPSACTQPMPKEGHPYPSSLHPRPRTAPKSRPRVSVVLPSLNFLSFIIFYYGRMNL